MQNVLGEGDFEHYQGVWRMQSLPNCRPNGGNACRLTYAVEIKPKGFLPVKLIEGRIAIDLKANLAAIRDFVEGMGEKVLEVNEIENEDDSNSDLSRGVSEGISDGIIGVVEVDVNMSNLIPDNFNSNVNTNNNINVRSDKSTHIPQLIPQFHTVGEVITPSSTANFFGSIDVFKDILKETKENLKEKENVVHNGQSNANIMSSNNMNSNWGCDNSLNEKSLNSNKFATSLSDTATAELVLENEGIQRTVFLLERDLEKALYRIGEIRSLTQTLTQTLTLTQTQLDTTPS